MSTCDGLYLVQQMKKEKWIYCGGEDYRQNVNDLNAAHETHSQQAHWNYYLLKRQSTVLPEIPKKTEQCVCCHDIFWNEYLMSPDHSEIRIVGSSCIKKFTGGILRTCAKCGVEHQTRTHDLCKVHKKDAIKVEKIANKVLINAQQHLQLFDSDWVDRITDLAIRRKEEIECEINRKAFEKRRAKEQKILRREHAKTQKVLWETKWRNDCIHMIENPSMEEPLWVQQLRDGYGYIQYEN